MITKHPDPRLQAVEKTPVPEEKAQNHCMHMAIVLSQTDGVGLAANQAGFSTDLFIYNDSEEEQLYRAVLNPKIVWASEEMETKYEGCLSLPKVNVNKTRHKEIIVQYTEWPGMEFVEERINGYKARIFQHEIDHLSGKLIIDK